MQYVAFQLAQQHLPYDQPILQGYEARDVAALSSAIHAPFQTAGGKDCYRGLAGKAAALFYFLAKAHAFPNGNKRIAVTTFLVFLQKNGKWIDATVPQLIDTAVRIAGSDSRHQKRAIEALPNVTKKFLINFADVIASIPTPPSVD